MAFMTLRYVPSIPTFLRVFIKKGMLYFVKCFFCICWQDHMVLILFNVVYNVDWFMNMEPALQPRNKSHLVMVNNFFFKFIYFEGERECVCVSEQEGAEREGERESQSGSTLSVQSPELPNSAIVTWADIKSQMLNRLSHPGTPMINSFKVLLNSIC